MDKINESQKQFKPFFRQRSFQLAVIGWLAALVMIFALGRGGLAVHLTGGNVIEEITSLGINIVFALLVISLTYWLTRRRPLPDFAERVGDRVVTMRETTIFWLYLGVGLFLGGKLGIGLHLPGTIFGTVAEVLPQEVYLWMAFNFVYYASIPYIVFRRLGYSNADLGLRSLNKPADVLLILVVLIFESVGELAGLSSAIFDLTPTQIIKGALLTFIVHLVGTGIPVMIAIYSILIPRYAKLSNSLVTTTILGGLSYAAFHLFEFWVVYDSPANTLLSVLFVFTQFFGPGLVKSFLTVRSGNAWVHLWAYHAIAPHVTIDTPLMVKIFKLK